MKTLFACFVMFVVCLTNSESQANGLLQKLPKDGSWVRYHIIRKNERPGKIQETSGTMTIRSVGRETVNGEPCRWIEIQMEEETGKIKTINVQKILVPTKIFTKGKTVAKKVIRGWKKRNKDDPQKLNISAISDDITILLLLPDPSRETQTIKEKKVINYQKGKLEVDTGIAGSLILDQSANPNKKVSSSFIFFYWIHDKVPFGTAGGDWNITIQRDGIALGNAKMTFTLEDFGTDAKSAMPNHN